MNGSREEQLPLIDSHIHLDRYERENVRHMLEEAFRSGLQGAVAVSMGLESCVHTRELAQRYPGKVLPAYGWHPEQPLPPEHEIDGLMDWIRSRHDAGERFAIGEVGLPYYTRTEAESRGEAFHESGYLSVLERFAALAVETDRPLVLHAVYEDALKAAAILRKYGVKRAHFHWYKGDEETTTLLAESGYWISITPDVVYEPDIRQLAASYPLGQLMTETDGPWPFQGPFAGHPTGPLMMRESIRHIAELRGMGEEQAALILAANARQFYELT